MSRISTLVVFWLWKFFHMGVDPEHGRCFSPIYLMWRRSYAGNSRPKMQYGGLKALCCCIMVGVKNRNNESCLSRDCHSSMGKMLLGPHGQQWHWQSFNRRRILFIRIQLCHLRSLKHLLQGLRKGFWRLKGSFLKACPFSIGFKINIGTA